MAEVLWKAGGHAHDLPGTTRPFAVPHFLKQMGTCVDSTFPNIKLQRVSFFITETKRSCLCTSFHLGVGLHYSGGSCSFAGTKDKRHTAWELRPTELNNATLPQIPQGHSALPEKQSKASAWSWESVLLRLSVTINLETPATEHSTPRFSHKSFSERAALTRSRREQTGSGNDYACTWAQLRAGTS